MKPMKDASMACEKAGDMYYKGIGADKSSFSAMIYYGKGCDNKSEYCCKMFKEINKK